MGYHHLSKVLQNIYNKAGIGKKVKNQKIRAFAITRWKNDGFDCTAIAEETDHSRTSGTVFNQLEIA